MAVALVHCRIGREAVEITIASGIPNPDTFAARQNDTERLVVLAPKRASVAMKSETGPIFSSLPSQQIGINWVASQRLTGSLHPRRSLYLRSLYLGSAKGFDPGYRSGRRM